MSDQDAVATQVAEIVGQIARVVDAEGCTVFLHDPATNQLWSRVLADGSHVSQEIRVEVGEGIAGQVMETGEPVNIADAGTDPRVSGRFDRGGFVTRSMLCVPLESPHGERLGVIQVLNKRGGAFSDSDQAVVEGLSPQVAIALDNARLASHAGTNRADAAAGGSVESPTSRRGSEPLSEELKQLLVFSMEQIGRTLEAEASTLFLFDAESNELWSAVATGEGISEIRVRADEGIAGWVMQNAAAVNIPDAYADERFNPEVDRRSGFRTRNVLCCPIYDLQKEQRGVVQVLNKIGGAPFTQHDEQLLRYCGDQAATSIENAQLYASVSALRSREQELTRRLEGQHRELQEAFHEIEQSKAGLEGQLRGRTWIRRSLLGVAATVFALAAILALPALRPAGGSPAAASTSAPGDAERHTVEVQEVSDSLQLPGTVRPARWIEVTSPLEASVVSLHFRYGEPVTRGQTLAVLDVIDQMKQLREAKTAHIEALDALERLKNWASGTEVQRARRELLSAEEGVAEARRALADSQRLFERDIIARSELEAAEATLRDRERALVGVQESLASVLEEGSASKLQIAQLRLDNAAQTLTEIQAAVGAAVVVSPADGIIFPATEEKRASDAGGEPVTTEGARVSRGGHLFSIASMQGITVEVQVPESQILEIAKGQKVQVGFDALDVELDGEIAVVAGRAVKEYADEPAVFPITVAVDEIDEDTRQVLRLGMSATASIETYSNPEAVVVPFDAVFFDDGETYVRVESASGIERRAVSVLLTLRDGIALEDGVEAGEVILVGGDL